MIQFFTDNYLILLGYLFIVLAIASWLKENSNTRLDDYDDYTLS